MKRYVLLVSCLLAGFAAQAKVVSMDKVYMHGAEKLEGFVAYDDAMEGKRPVVLVVHQWMGLGDYEKARAKMLAEMGYLAFCVDMYGQGKRAENREQAIAFVTAFRSDRALMRARAQAGLDAALALPQADASKVGAIGYCFGGGVVLELARSGAEVKATVSFHGNLDTPNPRDAKQIKGSILVCHGGADTNVGMEGVEAFHQEMEAAKVDYALTIYAGAVHGFTHFNQPERYNEVADKRSWAQMQAFFDETLK